MQRVVWVMNLAAPYRLSLWRELATMCDLEVWVLASNERNRMWTVPEGEQYKILTLKTIRLQRGEATHYVLTRPVRASLMNVDAIVLPSWENPAAWQLMWLASRRGVKLLGFNEATPLSQRTGFLASLSHLARSRFYQSLDAVVTVGSLSSRLVSSCGVEEGKIFEGRNSVDVGNIRRVVSEVRAGVINTSESSRPGHKFVFVGQLIQRKEPALAIQALWEMDDRNCRLVIAGDGPLMADLISLVAQLRLSDRVSFTGHLAANEVIDLLARSNTLVLPSSAEVWGLVVNEALAAGLHVVVSDRCGVAADIKAIPGVWIAQVDRQSLMRSMTESIESWRGPLDRSDRNQFLPKDMALVVRSAITRSLSF